MNIKSKKWLLCCAYNPNKSLIENHLRQLQKQLEASTERCEHFLIMGDFNADVSDPSMTSFCTLIFVRNRSLRFSLFSLFHFKLFVTILRTSFEPLPPKIIKYRNYKNFYKDKFDRS